MDETAVIIFWRREWDSNPRSLGGHGISNAAQSATLTSLHIFWLHHIRFTPAAVCDLWLIIQNIISNSKSSVNIQIFGCVKLLSSKENILKSAGAASASESYRQLLRTAESCWELPRREISIIKQLHRFFKKSKGFTDVSRREIESFFVLPSFFRYSTVI